MRKTLLTSLAMLFALCTSAQTDITQYFLTNYGFDQNFDYTATQSNNVAEEIKTVDGWTADLSATYTVVGTYEFGFKGVYNTASVPSKGYNGEAGGGLAISTGWEQTFLFYQTVTLPAGTYTLRVPTYNGSSQTAATSQVAWIPSSGTSKKSTVKSYPVNTWTLDEISFTLTKTTTGKIQFGMKAAAGGSGNSAKLVIDYVQLLGENIEAKSVLESNITTATTLYGDGTGCWATDLQPAIAVAQAVTANESARVEEILSANKTLLEAYNMANAIAKKYTALTSLITSSEAQLANTMTKSVAEALQTAIDAAKQPTTSASVEAIETATAALNAALAEAKTSVTAYKTLNTQIAAINSAYDETKAGATELKAALDNATAMVEKAEATTDEVNDETESLKAALLAFNIANATPGTGTAPKVTVTNPYVATGATEALVRATTIGSNVLERGVCWSTEHNPTVLDNRTTKSFTLNGTIFHIKGLKVATVYYVRPYVMNKTYTVAYGDEIKIVTHPKGTCTWSWDDGAPSAEANNRCRTAMEQTIAYFNEWTGIKGFHLSGHYGAQTPTADCSYGGWMRIGPNAGNQAIGTVLHETGHGVGVGTQARWSDTNVHNWQWLGREANTVLRFLENKEDAQFVGDGQHGWGQNATYDWLVNGADKDTHQELQYIGGMCILHGLFIDGLCPTGNDPNGIAGYTYNFNDTTKYYLMSKSASCGLGDGLLYQRTATGLSWKPLLSSNEAVSDSAAWYIEFNPNLGTYMFKNAETGRYMTHSATSSNVSLKNVSTPSTTERFQLMPDRTDVTIGTGSKKIKTHGYWFTWYSNGNKSMQAKTLGRSGYGNVTQETFDYTNAATAQQWIIISADELEAYQAAAVATGIRTISTGDTSIDGEKTVVAIYSTDGTLRNETRKGFNIVKYSDGTSKKIYVK